MEYACFIKQKRDIDLLEPHFTRVYFGEELCENRFPSNEKILEVAHQCILKKLNFSLVTCVFSDEKLSNFISLLDSLIMIKSDIEIIVNDIGVLYYCLDKSFSNIKVVIGRLLNKLAKTPRYKNIENQLNRYQKESLGVSLYMNKISSKFFHTQKVFAYEVDNIYQLCIPDKYSSMNIHLIMPFVLVTVTRNCFYNGIESNQPFTRKRKKCNHECMDYNLTLNHNTLLNSLECYESGIFYKNDKIDDSIKEKVNRIVVNSFYYNRGRNE